MTLDTRTPAEIRYDAERDGSLYVKPQPAGDDPDTIIAITEQLEAHHDQRMRRGRSTDAAWSAIIDVLVNTERQQRTTPAEDALITQILLELDGGE
jgi:hypothetical protein